MGLLDRIFNRRVDVHVHVHVDGTLRVDKDGIRRAIEGTPRNKDVETRPGFVPKNSIGQNLNELDLGSPEIPVVDFGEQVKDD